MSSSSTTNTNATEALHILLSPDGYYTYLNVPKPSPSTHKSLLSKDSGPGSSTKDTSSSSSSSTIDKTRIEKNYRKKSLRLHPDRPGGDEEAFRILERAKHVLLSDKLRKEYDMIGLDLEEEDDHGDDDDHDHGSSGDDGDRHDGDDKKDDDSGGSKNGSGSGSDSIISQMASSAVAAILQLAVRTAMMAATSVILTRFKYLTIPAILFLSYTSVQIFRARLKAGKNGPITVYDVLSPMLIGFGILCMYFGRGRGQQQQPEDGVDDGQSGQDQWSKKFWIGETLVMTIFGLNTLASRERSDFQPSLPVGIAFYVLFSCFTLYIRGKGWRYASFLAFELGMALVAVMVFPIMEMILEEIMNEKLRKVGERVRQYSKVMNDSYQAKLEEMGASLSSGGGGGGSGKNTSGAKGRGSAKTQLEEMD